MSIIASIVSGVFSGTFGNMFSGFFDARNMKSQIEAGVIGDVIQADIAINQMKLHAMDMNRERWETRFIMPGFAYLMMFHVGAVVLDSVFHYGWKIAALPGPIAEWEGQIILSFFIVGTTQNLVRQWINRGVVSGFLSNVKDLITGGGPIGTSAAPRRFGREK